MSKYSVDSPILFLVFNRPDTTQKVFDAIKDVRPKKLYIAADGPRKNINGENKKCEQVRNIFNNIDWECEVVELFRETNLGCGLAVSSAISWFFEHEEMGIILEDDCLPDFSFFYYCDILLSKYQFDNRIFHISGFSGGIKGKEISSYHFSVFPRIWGWATWKRAWNLYDFRMTQYSDFESLGGLNRSIPNRFAKVFWEINFNGIVDQKIDTWDFQWVYTLLSNNGLSINPNTNLVKNIGFSEEATHTKNVSNEYELLDSNSLNVLIHPFFVFPDEKAESELNAQFLGKSLKSKIKLGITYLKQIYINNK